jgi:hypothetical protein
MTVAINQPIRNKPRKLAVCLFIASICGPFVVALSAVTIFHRIELAESAVTRFHEQLNAGQYSEIYAQSTAELKQSMSEAEFTQWLEKIRFIHGMAGGLGKAGEKRRKAIKIAARLFGGIYITLPYETDYPTAKADETFVFSTRGGQARLDSYEITSPAVRAFAAAESGAGTPIPLVFSGENKNAEWKTQPDGTLQLQVTQPVVLPQQ